jgi:hypothetical protein
VVDEIVSDATISEEVNCVLGSWNNQESLMVDGIQGTKEGVMRHCHDAGVFDTVVVLWEANLGVRTRVGD